VCEKEENIFDMKSMSSIFFRLYKPMKTRSWYHFSLILNIRIPCLLKAQNWMQNAVPKNFFLDFFFYLSILLYNREYFFLGSHLWTFPILIFTYLFLVHTIRLSLFR
jgi:hypothetical protein